MSDSTNLPPALPGVAATPSSPQPVDALPPVALEAALEAEKPQDKFSSKFAALARREKQLLAREAKMKEAQSKYSNFEKYDQEFKREPLRVLKERYNLSYEDLTKLMLNDQKPTPEMVAREAQERVERFEREQKEKEERQFKENLDRQVQTFVSNIKGYLEENKSTYELTAAHPEGHELVYNVIEDYWNKNERILSTKDASEEVEKYLERDFDEKYRSLGKIKSRFAPQPVQAEGAPGEALKPGPQSAKTLTNSHQTQVAAPSQRPLSIEESKELAAKILKWT